MHIRSAVYFGYLSNLRYMPNINAAGQTHDQLQAACWKAAQQLYWPFLDQRLICIPNDMHAGNVARWKQYEALGVTPGVWDMQLLWIEQIPNNVNHAGGVINVPAIHWFEFKVGRDDLSAKQKQFRKRMLPIGHKFYVVEEQEQFANALELIIKPTLHIAKEIWKEELEVNGKKRHKEE